MAKGGSKDIPETEEERALAEVARGRLRDFQERFVPSENEFIRNLEVTEFDEAQMRGIASSATQREFDQAQDQILDQQTSAGVNPNSGRYQDALNKVIQRRGIATGGATANANAAMDRKRITNLEAGIGLGRGQSSDAFTGMGQIAQDMQNRAIDDRNRAIGRRQGTMNAIGNVAGGVAGYYQNENKGDG